MNILIAFVFAPMSTAFVLIGCGLWGELPRDIRNREWVEAGACLGIGWFCICGGLAGLVASVALALGRIGVS